MLEYQWEDGGSHQSIEDIALMRAIPGMVVLCPCDAVETKKMVLLLLNIMDLFI